MIKQSEIQKLSELHKVPKNQIDKDWVLGYFLQAIFSIPELKEIMIFKGGTCLKKCYFPGYRFSEDLDFTILESRFKFDKRILNKIMNKATQLSFDDDFNRGILFKLKKIEPTRSKDIEQGYKVYIYYWGADHRKNDLPSDKAEHWHHTIKLDINHTEDVIFPVNHRHINHGYSDNSNFDKATVSCYSIEEVLSEKLRSLIQRKYTSPRDCYDIWFLKNNYPGLDWKVIKKGFMKKMKSKDIPFEGVGQLMNGDKENILKKHWETQLSNQFPHGTLPEIEIILTELNEHFKNIF